MTYGANQATSLGIGAASPDHIFSESGTTTVTSGLEETFKKHTGNLSRLYRTDWTYERYKQCGQFFVPPKEWAGGKLHRNALSLKHLKLCVPEGPGLSKVPSGISQVFKGGVSLTKFIGLTLTSEVDYSSSTELFFQTNTAARTETRTTYYQGMSHDFHSGAVRLPDSQGRRHEDLNQLAGDVLETTAFDYAGGPVSNSQISSYWVSPAVMTRPRVGLPPLIATMTGQVEQWTRQALTDPGKPLTWRKTETDTSYDADPGSAFFGLPRYIYQHGDLANAAQHTCTTITYAAANKTENLTGLPAETETDAAACNGPNPGGATAPGPGQINALSAPAGLNRPVDVISDSRTFYDDPALARTWPKPAHPPWPQAPPGNGDVSVVQNATGYADGAFTYQTSSAVVYDTDGRVVASYDGNGGFDGHRYHPTTTAYTMTGGSTTATRVSNPLGQGVTTSLDPLRGLALKITDANHVTTTLRYDGLGRLTDVWANSRPLRLGPTFTYSYLVSRNRPVVVTTRQFTDFGVVVSTTLYDSLLRVRQTQDPTPVDGIEVSDTFYDNHGWVTVTNANWFQADARPGSGILTVHQDRVPDRTTTQYDGLGRPVVVRSYDGIRLRSTAYTGYYGDKLITVPPAGGTPTATVTDALGRTTELDTYTSRPRVSTVRRGGFIKAIVAGGASRPTRYTYNNRGQLATTTNAGRTWTSGYNLLGQATAQTTPDAGTATMSYDADGNLTSATNANHQTITYTYDSLSRLTSEHNGPTPASPAIGTWVYDNANHAIAHMSDPVGQLTTATTFDSQDHAYKIQQTGFNTFGEATGERVTIPRAPGTGPLAGTYAQHQTYSLVGGLPMTTTYPASPRGGSLPAENVGYGYCTSLNLLCAVTSDLASYAGDTTYNQQSLLIAETVGPAGTLLTDSYDLHTGNLTRSQVTPATGRSYDTTSYAYDPSGNITAQADVRNPAGRAAQTEVQCYRYDTLDQLTQAWSTNGRPSCQSGPPAGTVHDGIPGGAYWTTWAYNPAGNQATQTQHALTGGPAAVTTYRYNNGQGTSTGQPDTLTTATTTGPGAGVAGYTYDPVGNTLTRSLPAGNQTLTWTPLGHLATDTTNTGTTSYQYDANGNLLLQQAPAQTTLYLFGEQLTWTRTGTHAGQVTGIRILPLPGALAAVRTGTGAAYTLQSTDLHGTSLLTLNHNARLPVWRQYTPYGAPRGKAPPAWPDTNGYLNKPTSPGTGLTLIGARAYDPTTGRFQSTDPAINATSPQTLNGYTYAADNPTTQSDPTGLYLPAEGGPCYSTYELGCTNASLQNPQLSLTNVVVGAASAAYDVGKGLLSLIASGSGYPQIATVLNSLPNPITNTQPGNPSFGLGAGIVFGVGFLIPGGDEAAAIDIGTETAATDLGIGSAASAVTDAAARDVAPSEHLVTTAPADAVLSALEYDTPAAVAAHGAGAASNQVIIDTNEVFNRPGVKAALNPDQTPVITQTTVAELQNLVARGPLKMPRFAGDLPVISDVMDVNARINIRGMIAAMKPNSPGLFGDGSIGATALNAGLPVITADRNFAAVLRLLGVEVAP